MNRMSNGFNTKVLSLKSFWFPLSPFYRKVWHLCSCILLEQGVENYTMIIRGCKVKKKSLLVINIIDAY